MDFEELCNVIQQRISLIELPDNSFTVEKNYNEENQSGLIVVKKGKIDIVRFHYMRKCITGLGGIQQFRASQTVHVVYYAEWYHNYLNRRLDIDVHIDEDGNCDLNEANDISFEVILDRFLPIGNDEEKKEIELACSIFKFDINRINYDSIKHAYVVDSPTINTFIDSITVERNEKSLLLCKYVSFDTLISMLNNRTFRMNSIVGMNDSEETLWASQIAQPNYIDNEKYKFNVIDLRHILVTSFTDKSDDATMWRLYTNNGIGACLVFKVPGNRVMRVRYVGDDNDLFQKLHNISTRLNAKNIKVIYKGLDEKRFFIKDSSYRVEGEYRFLYDAKEEDLQLANYNGLLSPYKDFAYDEASKSYGDLPFELVSIIIGNNISNFMTNEPLLFAKIHKQFPNVGIYESKVDSLR